MRKVKNKIFRLPRISEGTRDKPVCFRLNIEEIEYIKKAAKISETSESELMRSASLKRARWIIDNTPTDTSA